MTVTYTDAAPDTEVRLLLAREVHDRIGSGLALVLRRLDLLEHTLAAAPAVSAAERRRLADLRSALADALGTTRDLVSSLRGAASVTGTPESLPLEAALRAYLRSEAPTRTETRLLVRGDHRWLPHRVADELFVILRECLRNVLAHADARLVSVVVTIAPHEVNASVHDNGTGFDPAVIRVPGRAHGLLAMEERANALDGTTTITSAPGRGTGVCVWMPINERSIHLD